MSGSVARAKSLPVCTVGGGSASFDGRLLEVVLAMIEPTRCQILLLLAQRGPLSVGDIAGGFKISRPAISHHLKVLKNGGLVQTERAGQSISYSARMDRITQTLRSLADRIESYGKCCPRGSK